MGHDHHHHHGGHHDHHHDHHAGDDRRDSRGGGPEGTEFLELEITQMLATKAHELAQEASLDLLRSAIRSQLEQRLGPELDAIARVAADSVVADFDANRQIEALIANHRELKQSLLQQYQEALANARNKKASTAPRPKKKQKSTRRK